MSVGRFLSFLRGFLDWLGLLLLLFLLLFLWLLLHLHSLFLHFLLFAECLVHFGLTIEVQIFLLQLLHNLLHDIFVLFDLSTVIQVFHSCLDLFFQSITKSIGRLSNRILYIDEEMVETSSNRTFVSNISGNFALVLAIGSSDKATMI